MKNDIFSFLEKIASLTPVNQLAIGTKVDVHSPKDHKGSVSRKLGHQYSGPYEVVGFAERGNVNLRRADQPHGRTETWHVTKIKPRASSSRKGKYDVWAMEVTGAQGEELFAVCLQGGNDLLGSGVTERGFATV